MEYSLTLILSKADMEKIIRDNPDVEEIDLNILADSFGALELGNK